jgi:hypothetical protein
MICADGHRTLVLWIDGGQSRVITSISLTNVIQERDSNMRSVHLTSAFRREFFVAAVFVRNTG